MRHVENLEKRWLLSTWYVATNGSDAGRGNAAHPFRTIQEAATVAQPGDTVIIRKGTYHESVVPANSGTASAPITYKAAAGQTVVIDGADPVSNWTTQGNGIFQTTIPSDLGAGNDQVFFNGQMLTEARWPNSPTPLLSPLDEPLATIAGVSTTSPINGIATATITFDDTNDTVPSWVGATIHVAPGSQWVYQTGTVTASSPGSLTYSYTALNPYSYQVPTAGNHFYLTGIPAALDAPGEWYIDPASDTLSLIPPSGGAPAAGAVEVKQRIYGFDLSDLSYIDISGINFFACAINSNVNSSNDILNGITARYVSQLANKSNPWADQYLPGTTGILLNGNNDELENSIVDFSSGDDVYLGGNNDAVSNCIITDADYVGGDQAAITCAGMAEQVVGNTIYNSGRYGVNIRYSPQTSVQHNRIYNCGLLTADVGGIYTYDTDGQGATIAYNVVSDVEAGGFGGAGVFLDNNSNDYIVDHNVDWNVDIGIKTNPPSMDNTIVNNTLIGTQACIDGNGNTGMAGSELINNIFIGTVGNVGAEVTIANDLFNNPGVKFVSTAKDNYQLSRGSAGIGAGESISPYTDSSGKHAPDIGAYPYGQKPFAVGSTITAQRMRSFARILP